jgi:hypothetical protein
MRLRRSLAAAALAASVVGATSAANAGTVFMDNFDSYPYLSTTGYLNWVAPAKWTVPSGSVDLIGLGTVFNFLPPADDKFIDLDGSTGQAGTLETLQSFAAGTYGLSFLLAGNRRGDVDKTTTITLGDWSTSITLASDAGPTLYSLVVATSGGKLSFADNTVGNQNIGNLLDDVTLSTPVPELSTWAMLGFGFSGIGYAMMRRRKTPIALA